MFIQMWRRHFNLLCCCGAWQMGTNCQRISITYHHKLFNGLISVTRQWNLKMQIHFHLHQLLLPSSAYPWIVDALVHQDRYLCLNASVHIYVYVYQHGFICASVYQGKTAHQAFTKMHLLIIEMYLFIEIILFSI